MKRWIAILSMIGAFVVGTAAGVAHADHEHDYDETTYVTSPCCLYDEEHDCEDNGDTRVCRRSCAAWGKKMKQYERCACGAKRFVSATECSSNL